MNVSEESNEHRSWLSASNLGGTSSGMSNEPVGEERESREPREPRFSTQPYNTTYRLYNRLHCIAEFWGGLDATHEYLREYRGVIFRKCSRSSIRHAYRSQEGAGGSPEYPSTVLAVSLESVNVRNVH